MHAKSEASSHPYHLWEERDAKQLRSMPAYPAPCAIRKEVLVQATEGRWHVGRVDMAHGPEGSASALADVNEDLQCTEDDIEDAKRDVATARKRIKRARRRALRVHAFQKEAQLRLSTLRGKMDEADAKESEGGRADAWAAEWRALSNQLSLSTEELRLLEVSIRREEDAVRGYTLEIAGLEVDLADLLESRGAALDLQRRMELSRRRDLAEAGMVERIKEERARWKVDLTKEKALQRSRKGVQALAPGEEAQRRAGLPPRQDSPVRSPVEENSDCKER